MAKSEKIPIDWSMKNLDSGELLLPPYPISESGVRISIGGVIVEQARYGFQDPLIQWTSGKTRTITFSSALFTADRTESITAQFAKFEKLTTKDEALGRPPIVVWNLGTWVSELVLVTAIDPEIPPIRPDGQPRQVILNFSLTKYKPFSQVQIDPTKPTKESYYLVVTSAEQSYEAIARRMYGDPLAGDLLRRRHPEEPFQPSVGAKIDIPARSIILKEEVTPRFHALKEDSQEAAEAFERILELRNVRKAYIDGKTS